MLRPANGILRFEVVEIAFRHNLDNRQRFGILIANNGNRVFAAFDIPFNQHFVINLEGLGKRLFNSFNAFNDEHTDGASFSAGLYNHLFAHGIDNRLGINLLAFHHGHGRWGRDVLTFVKHLRLRLVHSQCA